MTPKAFLMLFLLAAGALVVGSVAATLLMPETLRGHAGCGVLRAGDPEVAARSDDTVVTRDGGAWRATRTAVYELPAPDAARLVACTDTGGITVVADAPAAGPVTVTATMASVEDSEAEARERTAAMKPTVRAAPGRIAAYEAPRPTFQHGTGMSLRISVPATMQVDAWLQADTGSVTVEGARLTGLRVDVDTGSVRLDPGFVEGDVDVHTDTGKIDARFPALGTARIDMGTDTGSIELRVPSGPRHGYAIHASTDTGSIRVDLPDVQTTREERHRMDQDVEARTRGYDSREVKVPVHLSTDTGSVTIASV